MSYAVAQSSRELGLRAALGAAPADLLRMVLSRGIRLAAFGIAVGAAVALGCSRLLGYLLYKVSPRDPLIFAMAVAIMTVAALAASLGPAWRASRADALTTLRAS
jgi:putative ABC transport system permease protein